MSAPGGRRLAEVAAVRDSGAFRIVSLLDRAGPAPAAGQFYELAAGEGSGPGSGDRGSSSPQVLPVAETAAAGKGGVRLDFLLDPGGPEEAWLAGLGPGEGVRARGPLGDPFASPRQVSQAAAGAVLVGGGVGAASLALLRRSFADRAVPHRVLLGFRDRAHTGGLDLFCGSSGALCPEVRLATEDGHAGRQGLVTDVLLPILAGDDAGSAVVYAAGPPAMLATVRTLCESNEVPVQTRGPRAVISGPATPGFDSPLDLD